jgi:hypothetical protein
MDTLKLGELGEKLGYSGETLKKFIDEEQAKYEKQEEKRFEQEEKRLEREERRQEREWKRQQAEKEQDRQRQEEEHKRELQRKEKELEILKTKMALSENKDTTSALTTAPRPKLPKFDENEDDMDAFLERFQRFAESQKWDKGTWAISLSPLLTGKGLQVYTSLPVTDSSDYEKLKKALLKRYQLTAEGFQKKFREDRPSEGESVYQFIARMKRYLQRWIDLSDIEQTFDGLCNLIIREQFVNSCNAELAVFIRERVPKNIDEMTKLAEQYLEAHELQCSAAMKQQKPSDKAAFAQSIRPEHTGHGNHRNQPGDRRCFICNRNNHIARDCFYKDSRKDSGQKLEADRGQQRPSTMDEQMWGMMGSQQEDNRMPTCHGLVNGKKVVVLRDTGCSSAAVKRGLVRDEQMTGKVSSCMLIDGTERQFEMANIFVDTPYYTGKVGAMVMENPMYELVLGNTIGVSIDPNPAWRMEGNAVLTRAQLEKQHKPVKPLAVPETNMQNIDGASLRKEQRKDRTLKGLWKMAKADTTKENASCDIFQRTTPNGRTTRVSRGEMPMQILNDLWTRDDSTSDARSQYQMQDRERPHHAMGVVTLQVPRRSYKWQR